MRDTLVQVFKLDHVVGVSGARKTGQNASLCNEKRASADRHKSSLSHGVLGLDLGVGLDESHGLGALVLAEVGNAEHVVGAATRNDDNVVVGEVLVSLTEGHVGLERHALGRGDKLGVADQGDFESLAFCERICQSIELKVITEEHVIGM